MKFVTLSLIGIFGLATFAQAMPAIERMRAETLKRERLALVAAKTSNDQCANFSGKWKGTCSNGAGQTSEQAVEINQFHCAYLEFPAEGRSIRIGGTEQHSNMHLGGHETSTTSFDWTESNTKLVATARSIHKSRGFIELGQLVSWMEIQGDKLLTLTQSNTTNGSGDVVFSRKETCEYVKE